MFDCKRYIIKTHIQIVVHHELKHYPVDPYEKNRINIHPTVLQEHPLPTTKGAGIHSAGMH